MKKKSLTIPASSIMANDRAWLKRTRNHLLTKLKKKQDCEELLCQWHERLNKSQERYAQRQQALPRVIYADELPIMAAKQEIIKLIKSHQVIVLAGETGSGKTTQIPKLCLEAGRGISGRVGHTQPRRLAARSVANRIAEELKVSMGQQVGYQVRFTEHCSDNTFIKIMTDGILLAEIQQDKWLNQYDTIIIDEAHERSLNIDFLLGYLKQLLQKRQDLKVIITSATIDVERFAKHFDDAPVIQIPGRTYPVDTHYWQPLDLNPQAEGDLALTVVSAMQEILARENQGFGHRHGDVLVFLPGEREIRECALQLRKAQLPHIDILPLYARLNQAEQNRIFQKHSQRRIVLATNVAETSLTVPGIRYVIDTGLARQSHYSYRSKVQRLPIERVSQASCNQRQGRCGRTAPGTCIRLYSEQDFLARPEFTKAEILRSNLAAVILQMLNLKLGDIDDFPFIDTPDSRLIRDGYKLLHELTAVDDNSKLTPLGKKLSRLPIDPRFGRMILAANQLGCLSEVLIITSGLSIQDPRERPADKQQQSQQWHARFNDPKSDFMSLVNLWNYFEDSRQALSQNQLRKKLNKEFLATMRLREWRDIHYQMTLAVKSLKFKLNKTPATIENIHRAILAGLLGNMAQKIENKEFLSARNRHVHLFPGSSLFKKPPAWLMAAELVETSKLYARTAGQIEPEWALDYAEHLVKKHYSEPGFSSRTGHVMANQRITLYGLTLVEKKRVTFSKIEPATCHELFLRQALVSGGYAKHKKSLPPFWQHNQALIAEIEEMEAKSRRKDILVDETILYDFYVSRVPKSITNVAAFEKWRHSVEEQSPQALYFTKNDLMRHGAGDVSQAQFPESLSCDGMVFPLSYHFEPGHPDDGVTITIPLNVLHQLSEHHFDYLVPGLLHEKCVALLKALPKPLRKQLVPIPDFVHHVLVQNAKSSQPLHTLLNQAINKRTGVTMTSEQWQALPLDDYYRMNFHITDENKNTLAQGRDLPQLKKQLQSKIDDLLKQSQVQTKAEKQHFTNWDFGKLREQEQFQQAGLTITAFPAIIDEGDSVSIQRIDTLEKAQRLTRQGLVRLCCLALPQKINYLRKQLFRGNQQSLILASIDDNKRFINQLIEKIVELTFVHQPWPNDKQSFECCINEYQGQMISIANDYEILLLKIFAQRQQLTKELKSYSALSFIKSVKDIKQQLNWLFTERLLDTPLSQLKHYPRYLRAISARLEKLSHNPKELSHTTQCQNLYKPLLDALNDDMTALYQYPQLIHYRWLLEEYRVSLFAQQLKTAEPVSLKRLQKAWPQIARTSRAK